MQFPEVQKTANALNEELIRSGFFDKHNPLEFKPYTILVYKKRVRSAAPGKDSFCQVMPGARHHAATAFFNFCLASSEN